MKQEIVELFTKRIIDYTLINWLEFMLVLFIFAFIIALFKTLFGQK